MACITTQNNNGSVYFYLSNSVREKGKKSPDSVKTKIGKVNKRTGYIEIADEFANLPEVVQFIEKKREQGMHVIWGSEAKQMKTFTWVEVAESETLNIGAMSIMEAADKELGLSKLLKECFGEDKAKKILNLAYFLAIKGEPLMYCESFLSGTFQAKGEAKNLTSQNISRLIRSLDLESCDKFTRKWAESNAEDDYLALDITSVSTWGELMNFAGWGYNRDKEKLAQVNLCLVCGCKSRLPLMLEPYEGEIKDVSTIHNMLKLLPRGVRSKCILVTDKGFFKTNAVNSMLKEDTGFLHSLPFTLDYAKDYVKKAKKERIDAPTNTRGISGDVVQMMTYLGQDWGKGFKVNVFVFHNEKVELAAKQKIAVQVGELQKLINEDPIKAKDDKEVQEFFSVRKKYGGEEGEYTFTFKQDYFDQMLETAGWLVCISNRINDAYKALEIYRDKDVVEKGHDVYKNELGFDRFRIHGDSAMFGVKFVSLISLIIRMWVHKKMDEANLYEKYTMQGLFNTVGTHVVHKMPDGSNIVSPATKPQKLIYSAMSAKVPADYAAL